MEWYATSIVSAQLFVASLIFTPLGNFLKISNFKALVFGLIGPAHLWSSQSRAFKRPFFQRDFQGETVIQRIHCHGTWWPSIFINLAFHGMAIFTKLWRFPWNKRGVPFWSTNFWGPKTRVRLLEFDQINGWRFQLDDEPTLYHGKLVFPSITKHPSIWVTARLELSPVLLKLDSSFL